MLVTNYFYDLPEETKESIYLYEYNLILSKEVEIIQLHRKRSIVYEMKNKGIILKKFLSEGKGDNDIYALLELNSSPYFPKIYAYKKREFLFVEKVNGKTLSQVLKEGITNNELKEIVLKMIEAKKDMMNVDRYDFDFKFEHIYWDTENSTLKWIDLGACVKNPIGYSEEEKKKRIKYCINQVKQQFAKYGYSLLNNLEGL
ncbi:hypothetical protein R6U76_13590 [Lysinibacillus capsici]|uniref:hypothetical protein n=1 Tax=Lysinibacillus capsici TaxID=2115968 RepID=UPI0029DE62B5|nr:hypothetical protein [Lysinibacillus capsici]WPK03710.1 hypothetical protein R6U76_13590 [Lysinibacillus capsici]